MPTSDIDDLTVTILEGMNMLRQQKLAPNATDGVRGPEHHVLWLIESLGSDGPVMPSDIARHLGVTSAAVSHHLNAMADKGLITRSASPDDGRVAYVELTETGRQAQAEFRHAIKNKVRNLVEYLGHDDAAALAGIITKIATYMQQSRAS